MHVGRFEWGGGGLTNLFSSRFYVKRSLLVGLDLIGNVLKIETVVIIMDLTYQIEAHLLI